MDRRLFTAFLSLYLLTQYASLSATEPTEISGLQVWLRADNIEKDDNDRVNIWNDSSGKGNNFSQPSSLRQPTIIEDSINRFPAIRFMGNDFIDSSSISALSSSKITSFIVFKMKVTPIRQDVMTSDYRSGAGKASDELWGFHGQFPDFGAFTHKTDGKIISVMKKSERHWNICSMVWNSSSGFNVWLDGVSGKSLSGANANPSGHLKTRIGAGTDDPKHFSRVDISEILIYNRALSEAERINVETYLQDKYFGDHEGPKLTAVAAMGDPKRIVITFNEGVDEVEAGTATNYIVDNGIKVSGSVLIGDENRVELALSSPLQKGTKYLLKINNIKDLAGNLIMENTEASFEFADIPADDLILWLRGDSFVTTDDEGGVLSWEDQSGNSNRATVPKPEKDKPLISGSALNGKAAISFSGKKCAMKCAAIPELDTDKITWFIVLKTISPDKN
ncbi:MAG: hypothetical protein A2X45_01305 [Lentisphaerae bacterium GWF2_50_93]|nr:MAG: hypothetical protein A2X45_01305 [Lentisphaerae bacterium GWF2_50_93]